jgi:hypothetical protein
VSGAEKEAIREKVVQKSRQNARATAYLLKRAYGCLQDCIWDLIEFNTLNRNAVQKQMTCEKCLFFVVEPRVPARRWLL